MRVALSAIVMSAIGISLGSGVASALPAPEAPSADQLTSQLQRVLNASVSDQERAGELQGGASAVPTANNIAGVMDRYGSMMSWRVQNPSINGDQLDAQLAVTVPLFGTRTHNIYWVNDGGAWKLSNASACVIARDAAGTDCTV